MTFTIRNLVIRFLKWKHVENVFKHPLRACRSSQTRCQLPHHHFHLQLPEAKAKPPVELQVRPSAYVKEMCPRIINSIIANLKKQHQVILQMPFLLKMVFLEYIFL